MKKFLIAAALAAMSTAGAAYAASGSSGPSDNPQASPNSGYTGMPGSSATEGGSMRDPGGKNSSYGSTGAPATTSPGVQTAPQSGSSYGTDNTTGNAGRRR